MSRHHRMRFDIGIGKIGKCHCLDFCLYRFHNGDYLFDRHIGDQHKRHFRRDRIILNNGACIETGSNSLFGILRREYRCGNGTQIGLIGRIEQYDREIAYRLLVLFCRNINGIRRYGSRNTF